MKVDIGRFGMHIIVGLACIAIAYIGWYIADSYSLTPVQMVLAGLGGAAILVRLYADATC
jgi:hypothetical protein